MTRFLLWIFLLSFSLLSVPAVAAPRYWSILQAGTQSAPTGYSAGMDLADVGGYRVSVCLSSGTLVGGEKLIPYVLSYAQSNGGVTAKWLPVHANVLTVSAASGVALGACYGWADTPVLVVPNGRVYYKTQGFAASTQVSVDAWKP